MRPSQISYAFLGSFLVATFGLQWWQAPAYPWRLILVLGLLGIFGFFLMRTRTLAPASALGIALALFAVAHATHIPSPATPDFYAGSDVAIRGMIADDPDRQTLKTNYTVRVDLLKRGQRTIAVDGKILVTVRAGGPAFAYGDVIVAGGTLELPGEIEGFRYDHYLSRIGVYSLMKNPSIEETGVNRGNVIFRALFVMRRSIEDRINALLPEPHASLLAGLLLGSRGAMPQALAADFKTTGLTHIVAISGYNITMLITVMGTLLFWLPLKWRFWPSVLLIAAFTILTGASASAVRAAVMGILALLALQLGRTQTLRLSILWTLFFTLTWNPQLLWYDAGFALSYLALIGVTEVAPLLLPRLRWLPEHFSIRESLCLTLSAQLLASPWIFFLFGQLSLIAPVGNLLAPPLVPAATLLGVASLLGSTLWMPLGRGIAALAWLPLQWIIGVAHVLGALPLSSIAMPGLSTVWIVAYYACVAGIIAIRNGRASSPNSPAPCAPSPPAAVAGSGTHAQ